MPETGISLTQSGSYEGTFTATADLVNLLFEVVPGGGNPTPDSTAYFWIDNFSLEEIHPKYELVSRNRWTIVWQVSDRIKVISSQAWGEASKILKVKSGKQYRLRYTVDMGNLYPMHVIIYNPADGSYVYPAETGLSIYNSGGKMGTFTAAADSLELRFQLVSIPVGVDSVYCWLDNISVDEIVPYQEGGEGHENGGEYRYGFNGQEKSNEIYGEGNAYDFGARIQDPRLGRFFSIDKLGTAYNSGYAFAGDNPISSIDYNGNVEIIVSTYKTDRRGKLTVTTAKYVIETVEDIRGIARDAYKINIYQKETLMSQQVGNATYSWYGWQTSSITQDKGSGRTPEERKFSGVGGWIAKNLYKLTVTLNPVAKLGDALGYDQDQITGESKSVSQRAFQASEAVFDAITLEGVKLLKKELKKY